MSPLYGRSSSVCLRQTLTWNANQPSSAARTILRRLKDFSLSTRPIKVTKMCICTELRFHRRFQSSLGSEPLGSSQCLHDLTKAFGHGYEITQGRIASTL